MQKPIRTHEQIIVNTSPWVYKRTPAVCTNFRVRCASFALAELENASPVANGTGSSSGCAGTGHGRGGTGPVRLKSAFSSCNVYVRCKGAVERRRGTECVYLAPLCWRTHLSTKLGADSGPNSTHPGYRRHVGHDLLVRGILLGLFLIHQGDFFGKFPGVSHNGCYNVMYTENWRFFFRSVRRSPADAAKHYIVRYARAICRALLAPIRFRLSPLPCGRSALRLRVK